MKVDTSTWKIPKDIKMSDKLLDQPGSIYLLIGADLFYEMFHQAGVPVLATTQFYKKLFLGGHSLVRLQLQPKLRMTHICTLLLVGDNSLEHNINCFWEVVHVEQSSVTSKQHAIEQQNGKFFVRLPRKMNP